MTPPRLPAAPELECRQPLLLVQSPGWGAGRKFMAGLGRRRFGTGHVILLMGPKVQQTGRYRPNKMAISSHLGHLGDKKKTLPGVLSINIVTWLLKKLPLHSHRHGKWPTYTQFPAGLQSLFRHLFVILKTHSMCCISNWHFVITLIWLWRFCTSNWCMVLGATNAYWCPVFGYVSSFLGMHFDESVVFTAWTGNNKETVARVPHQLQKGGKELHSCRDEISERLVGDSWGSEQRHELKNIINGVSRFP